MWEEAETAYERGAGVGSTIPDKGGPSVRRQLEPICPFGRCSDPSKFLLVAIRAQAWVSALLERGWVTVTSDVEWALRPLQSKGANLVIAPLADGAVPLVLTTHQPSTTAPCQHLDSRRRPSGQPDFDSGLRVRRTRRRTRSIDRGNRQVDTLCCRRIEFGSCFVRANSCRTSFHGQSGTAQNLDRSTIFTAATWPQNWSARSLVSERHDQR